MTAAVILTHPTEGELVGELGEFAGSPTIKTELGTRYLYIYEGWGWTVTERSDASS